MKKAFPIIIVGVILILAGISNPSEEMHKQALKDKLEQRVAEAMDKDEDSDNPLTAMAQGLGKWLGGAIIDGIVDNLVSAENHIIFSLTKLETEDGPQTIGIGVFGNVFITKEIDKALDEAGINAEKGLNF